MFAGTNTQAFSLGFNIAGFQPSSEQSFQPELQHTIVQVFL